MKRAFLAMAIALLLCTGTAVESAVTLNPHIWGIPNNGNVTGPGGNCLFASNVAVSSGLLTITSLWAPSTTCANPGGALNGGTATVTGGAIFTKNLLSGSIRMEARAKIPGLGVHSTIWTLGAGCFATFSMYSINCPHYDFDTATGEIDIAEFLPALQGNTTTVQFNTHVSTGTTSGSASVTDYTQNFHTYAAVYTPGTSVVFYIDGTSQFTASTNVPTGPLFFIIDQETDSNGGTPNSGEFPATTQVQWIRICVASASACTPGSSTMILDEEFTAQPYANFSGFTP